MKKSSFCWILAFLASLLVAFPAFSQPVSDDGAPDGKADRCDLIVDYWNGVRSDRTFWAPFYESVITVNVRVTPSTCAWKIDNTGKPSWFSVVVVNGVSAGGGYYRGPGSVDIRIAQNSGYARSGRFQFVSSYAVPVDVGQFHYTGACLFNPSGTNGTQSRAVKQGFISIAQNMTSLTDNFVGQIVDNSTCTLLSPRPVFYTAGMTGATIAKVAADRPRAYEIRRSNIASNTRGEGALFTLSDLAIAQHSAVLALDLPQLAALPPDLRITSQRLDKSFISFGDGGGVVRIGGSVSRVTLNASRPCAFLPAYYQVLGGVGSSAGWLSVTSESGCKPGNPDAGTLVISAQPSQIARPRVGAIFTAWGTVLFVVQSSP